MTTPFRFVDRSAPDGQTDNDPYSHGDHNGVHESSESARGGGAGAGDGSGKAPATYVPAENLSREDIKREHNVAGINFEKYSHVPVEISGDNVPPPIKTFEQSGLHQLMMDAVRYMNYKTPTPIQKHSISAILNHRDVMGCAQTGSGKTAGYLLPMISNMLTEGVEPAASTGKAQPQILIICPTRELASQVDKEAHIYVEGSGYKTFALYGQTEMRYTCNKLRCGVNIIAATTGRLKDCLDKGLISLENLQYLVLDEADRMLDMGFSGDIDAVVNNRSMPKDRVTLMFSATFAPDIQNLAKRFLHDYIFIATGIVGGACGDVEQVVLKCDNRADKKEMLEDMLKERAAANGGKVEKTLIFCETKGETDKIGMELAVNDISSTTIHGDRSQEQREGALADFKSGRKSVLVATNVAARGLDIPDVQHVINWDLPKTVDEMSEYVHRIGRTGRVGNKGLATTFYSSRSSVVAPRLVEIMETSGSRPPDWLYAEAGMPIPGDDRSVPTNGQTTNRFGARDTRDSFQEPPPEKPAPFRFGVSSDTGTNGSKFGGPAPSSARPKFGTGNSDFKCQEPVSTPCRWDKDNQNEQPQREQCPPVFGGWEDGGGDSQPVEPPKVSRFGGFGRRAAQ